MYGFCEALKRYYRKNVQNDLKDESNLPQYGPDDEMCPFKKENFKCRFGVRFKKNYIHFCYLFYSLKFLQSDVIG